MLKDLIKLADYLDQKHKREMANQVDQLISRFAANPPWNDPESAPMSFKEAPGETTGEWTTDEEDMYTEELDPTEMVGQHKPTQEILNAIRKTLGKWDQHLLHVRWHIPGVSRDHMESQLGEDSEAPAYWAVTAAPNDPTEVPHKNHWAFWEVAPGEFGYELGEALPGQETRLYGEW